MKLINYGDTDWLIGDDAASLLLEYSILMARGGSADTVDMDVLSPEGDDATVSFLLGPATMMTARSVPSELPEPDNAATIAEVRGRIESIVSPPVVLPSDLSDVIDDYEF